MSDLEVKSFFKDLMEVCNKHKIFIEEGNIVDGWTTEAILYDEYDGSFSSIDNTAECEYLQEGKADNIEAIYAKVSQ